MTARRIGVLLLVVVIVLALALTVLDLRLAKSQTNSDFSVASSRPGPDGAAYQPQTTYLFIEPNGRLAAALREEFGRRLGYAPQVGQFELVDDPDAHAGQPLAYIEIEQQRINWYGVTAKADVRAELAYSSNGDLYFRGQEPVAFVSPDDGARWQLSGRYTIADTTSGLISLPGYHALLAEQLADQILNSLRQELTRSS